MADEPMQQENSIKAKIEKFEERFAVLRNEDYGEFRWPRKNLPASLEVGETIIIKAAPAANEGDDKYDKMRKLLEELIN